MYVCVFALAFVHTALSAQISIVGHLCTFPIVWAPPAKVDCGVGYHCVDLFVFSVCRPFLCASISAQFPSSVSPLCAHSKTEAAQRGPKFEKTNAKRAQSCANSQKEIHAHRKSLHRDILKLSFSAQVTSIWCPLCALSSHLVPSLSRSYI